MEEEIMNTKPVLTAVIICDQIITDKSDKHTLVGVFSNIWTQSFPAIHSKFVVFTSWVNNNFSGKLKLDIKILSPDNDYLDAKINNIDFNFDPNKIGTYGIFEFNGVKFPVEGKYYIEVCIDGEKIVVLPLEVKKRLN